MHEHKKKTYNLYFHYFTAGGKAQHWPRLLRLKPAIALNPYKSATSLNLYVSAIVLNT